MEKQEKDTISSAGGKALFEKHGVEYMRLIGRNGAFKRKIHKGGRPRASSQGMPLPLFHQERIADWLKWLK